MSRTAPTEAPRLVRWLRFFCPICKAVESKIIGLKKTREPLRDDVLFELACTGCERERIGLPRVHVATKAKSTKPTEKKKPRNPKWEHHSHETGSGLRNKVENERNAGGRCQNIFSRDLKASVGHPGFIENAQ